MSEKDELKELWKHEKEQLKRDLMAKEKIIQKREVPIRFNTQSKQSTPSKPQGGVPDSFLRSQLGL